MWLALLTLNAVAGPRTVEVVDTLARPVPGAVVLYDDRVHDALIAWMQPRLHADGPRARPSFDPTAHRSVAVDERGRWTLDCDVMDCASEEPRYGWVVAPGYRGEIVPLTHLRRRTIHVELQPEEALPEGFDWELAEPVAPSSAATVFRSLTALPAEARDGVRELVRGTLADRGEAWSSGCIPMGRPMERFVLAVQDGDDWVWVYESGGYAVSTTAVFVRRREGQWKVRRQKQLWVGSSEAEVLQAIGWGA